MAAKTPTSRVDKLLGSMGYGSRAEMARMGKAALLDPSSLLSRKMVSYVLTIVRPKSKA